MKEVAINEEECVGCGSCVEIDGHVFQMNSDDKAEVIRQPGADEAKRVDEAIETCPVSAISWE